MKLFVDDLRDGPDETWSVVRKVQPAISFLSQFNPDEISLDHDIENRPDDETFQPIAHYIGAKYRDTVWKPKIRIHSMNPTGAEELRNILADYGLESDIAPFEAELKSFNERYGF